MRIGIDARLWNETGIGRYIRNIIRNLSILDTGNEYVLFVLDKDYDQIDLPQNFKKVRTNVRWYTFSEQLIFPFILYREKLDLFFAPNLNVPVLYLKKFIVTIHDLTVLKMKTGRVTTLPLPFYTLKRLAVTIPLWYATKFSKAIFTVSEFVRQDIIKTFKVASSKVLITSCAASPNFKRVGESTVAEVLKRYSIDKPYLFYVGNAQPHKNLEKLLEAFELLKSQDTHKDLILVLGGKRTFFYRRIETEWKNKSFMKDVLFIGFIEDSDLPALYSGAIAYINPSLHEGFGIQTLEAFACGTKVVSSNTTSLPEVGGNIAYYFNPNDVKGMVATINTCLANSDESRIKAGYLRVADFSWEKSAKTILHQINKLAT